MKLATLLQTVILSMACGTPLVAAAADQCPMRLYGSYTLESMAPSIPPIALAAMFREVDQRPSYDRVVFPAREMQRAVELVAGFGAGREDREEDIASPSAFPGEYNWAGTVPAYVPAKSASKLQYEAYRKAATLYWNGELAAALSAFDTIVADSSSPYRAASAYSAARATLRRGEWADGIDRIARVIADPEFEEFSLPARDLVGTLAYHTNIAELVAAKYAQEMQALLAPALGDDADDASGWEGRELADLDWFLSLYRSSAYSGTPTVLDGLARHDRRFDLLRALAAPTPFQEQIYGGFRWSYPLARLARNGTLAWDESAPYADFHSLGALAAWSSADGRALTDHARAEWMRTGNLLWGLALARRTDSASDGPLLAAMLAKAGALPDGTAAACAKQPLVLLLLSQAVRLAVTDGRPGDGQHLIDGYRDYLVPPVTGIQQYFPDARMALRTSAAIEAPIVYYLRRGDLLRARDWQARMRTYVGDAVGEQWHVLLATDYSAAWAWTSDDPLQRGIGLMTLNSAFDMLSISRMVEIARLRTTPEPARRALIGASWVRSFAMGRVRQRDALLPDMRASFPELTGDLERVEQSRSPDEGRFRIAAILLANPGLGIYPSRLHEYASYLDRAKFSHAVPRDIRAIDAGNPNDGNWWCPLLEDRLRTELASGFFLWPTMTAIRDEDDRYPEATSSQKLEIADRLIAHHPLLHGVDRTELAALANVDSGPAMLSRAVFEWMDRAPRGSRTAAERNEIAAALHDVVRSTRYGCRRSGSTAAISREAYRRLHSAYPDSEWAHRTPYWFDR